MSTLPLSDRDQDPATLRARLLADRLTFGATPALLAEMDEQGTDAWLEAQLHPETITEDPRLTAALASFPSLHLPANTHIAADFLGIAATEHRVAHVLRAVWSKRQVLEVMTHFWHDHLNAPLNTAATQAFAPAYDAAIADNALGRFDELLLASAKTGTMMSYLDNATSRWPAPNENYARELMELHSLGVDGGYTEDDVKQAALALTGWGASNRGWTDTTFGYVYDPSGHYDEGPIQVMDWTSEAMGGPASIVQGESLIAYLAHHPATARHLSTKLVRRILGDGDHSGLIDRMTLTFRAHGTAIGPWLQTLFTSEEFVLSAGEKLRRPLEHVVFALRALDPVITPAGGARNPFANHILNLLDRCGHKPRAWPTPDGYPDEAEYWAASGNVLARWDAMLMLSGNRVSGVQYRPGSMLPDKVDITVGEAVDRLISRMLVREIPRHERDALLAYTRLDASAPATQLSDVKLRTLAALVLSTPTATSR